MEGLNAIHSLSGNTLTEQMRATPATERVQALGAEAIESAKHALSGNPAFLLGQSTREALAGLTTAFNNQVELMSNPEKTLAEKASSLSDTAVNLSAGVVAAGHTTLRLFQDGLDRHHRASLRAFVKGGTVMLQEMARLSGIPNEHGTGGFRSNVNTARIKSDEVLKDLFEKAGDRRLTQNELYQATKTIGNYLVQASNELHGKAVTHMFTRARAAIQDSPDYKALSQKEKKLVCEPISSRTLTRRSFEQARAAHRRTGEIGLAGQAVNQIHSIVAKGLKWDARDMQAAQVQAQEAKDESLNRLKVLTESNRLIKLADNFNQPQLRQAAQEQRDTMIEALKDGRSISNEEYQTMHSTLKEVADEMGKVRRANFAKNVLSALAS